MNRSRPQTRQFREREQAQGRTRTPIVRVHEQSANTLSQRAQTGQQTVRIRDRASVSTVCDQASAVDKNGSQAVRSLSPSMSAISPLTDIDREAGLAMNCPNRGVVVSISRPISFPVHIRIIRAYAVI